MGIYHVGQTMGTPFYWILLDLSAVLPPRFLIHDSSCSGFSPALTCLAFMGITVCRCCGGTIQKEDAAYNAHVCKSCAWLAEDLPQGEDPMPESLPVSQPEAPQPQAESSTPDRLLGSSSH